MRAAIVLTTVGLDFNARALASDLVQRRLVACVNIVDRVHSIYRREGKVTEDGEQLLIMKTLEEKVPELRDAVLAAHPYEVPEIVAISADAFGEYAAWLEDAVGDQETKDEG